MRSEPWLALLVALALPACSSDDSSGRGRDAEDSGVGGDRDGSDGTNGGGGSGPASGTGGARNPGGGASAGGREPAEGGGQNGGGGTAAGGAPAAGGQNGGGGTGGSPGAGGSAENGGAPAVILPEGSGWFELEDTKIAAVCACNDGFPELCANSGCSGIFAWSSGLYDPKRGRMIVFGGGHSDYFGNEIFGLSLVGTATMSRLTDPGLPPSTDCAPSIVGGTQPNSRHTYDSLVYIEHADRLFLFGGSKSPCGYLGNDTWTYSFASSAWEPHAPSGPIPNAVPGIVADYDPGTQKVLVHDDGALYAYDLEDDAFEQLIDNVGVDYHMSGVVDVAHRKLVLAGAGKVYTYDLAAGYARVDLATTGGSSIVDGGYPGLAYDPDDGGRVFAWNGGDTVYALDLDTAEWTAMTSPNGPGDANETGTYKRFRYVGNGTFALVNAFDQNAYLFRL